MSQSSDYPRIRQAIWLLALAFFLVIVLSIPVGVFSVVVDSSLAKHPATTAIINLVAIGIILGWGLKKTKASFGEVFPLVPVRMSLFFPMSLTVVGMSILLSEMDNVLRTVLPPPKWLTDFFLDLAGGQTSLWGSILLLVVVAPLTEELLFRGLMLRGFLSHYTARKAVLSSAILFGLFHFNPWQLLGATILGILFAWWFVRTRSLLPCLFGHSLNNALPLIFMAISAVDIPGYTSTPDEYAGFQPLWLDLVGLLLVASGVWLLMRMFEEAEEVATS